MQEEAARARYNAGNTTQRDRNQGYGAPNNYGSANNNVAWIFVVTNTDVQCAEEQNLMGIILFSDIVQNVMAIIKNTVQDHLYTHIHVKNNLNNSNGQNT